MRISPVAENYTLISRPVTPLNGARLLISQRCVFAAIELLLADDELEGAEVVVELWSEAGVRERTLTLMANQPQRVHSAISKSSICYLPAADDDEQPVADNVCAACDLRAEGRHDGSGRRCATKNARCERQLC